MQTKLPRGRPRPQETIDRDDRVLAILRQSPSTRNQLRERLGMQPGTEVKVYLSLRRLREQGLVRRCLGNGSETIWSADVEAPCP